MHADLDWHRWVMDRLAICRHGSLTGLKGAVVFLASAASGYACGVTIPARGGFLGR